MIAGPELLEGLVIALSIVGLTKKVLLAALAVLNGVLAILATLAVWKSYLVTGAKVLLTLVVIVPIAGVVWYMIWGQRRVREAT
jgi:hypothetical protein